jgi:hypothetical protein
VKRPSDKERLDWLSKWIKTRASRFRIGQAPWCKTVRQAIDAAMKAEAKPSAKGAGRGR